MSTLIYTPLQFIQHLESLEVVFRHSDLSRAFAQMVLPLPKGEDGNYQDGKTLDAHILAMAPPREWFEAQEARLAGTSQALVNLPPMLQALAPIQHWSEPVQWYEDERVGAPQLIDGAWLRPVEVVDLRREDNLQQLKDRLTKRLAAERYARETGGITIAGASVKTDRESQGTITGAYARAITDSTATIEWKAENGFVTLDAAAIIAVGAAVFNHVQSCFAREHALLEEIAAAQTVAGLLAIDIQAGWGGT